MTGRIARAVLGGIVLAGLVAPALSHVDDPKLRDRVPPYAGKGYRRGVDGPPSNAPVGFPSSGLQLRSWIPLAEFGLNSANGNDCWGYTAPSGREYALMGLSNGTGIVEITNPDNAQIIEVIPGPDSLWRDIKVYQNFAYVVTEGTGAGIQVISLSNVDAGVATLVNTINTGGTTSTHNVAINTDSGYLYRCGGSSLGMRVYSLANPTTPVLAGEWHTRYIHDLQAVTWTAPGPWQGKEIAFCCTGFNGGSVETGFEILDVTNKASITTIGRIIYPGGEYSHQVWISPDRQYAYLDDELDDNGGSDVNQTYVFSLTDLANPTLLGTFSNTSTAISHNLYTVGDYIFEANYRSGLRVFEVSSNPLDAVEVAFFDTWETDDAASFNGLWSNYPFFPSGTIIGSDIEKGLFVWSLELPQIAMNLPSGIPDLIPPSGTNVQVEIQELVPGGLTPGSAKIFVDVAGEGNFVQSPLANLGGDLWEGLIPASPCGAEIAFYFQAESQNGAVSRSPAGAPSTTYVATAAIGVETLLNHNMETVNGYTIENVSITGGAWQRGVPAGLGDRGDPTVDGDGSGACWLTENGAGNTDVDGGPTRLISSTFDLSAAPEAFISYYRWFTNDDADIDRLDVHVSNNAGGSWTLVESVPGSNGWQEHVFRVADFVTPTAQMRLRFSATDNPNDSVTEGAIDGVRVIVYDCDESIPGDVDGDGIVGFQDLLAVLSAWGTCPPGPCPADVNGDGEVGFADVLEVLSLWS